MLCKARLAAAPLRQEVAHVLKPRALLTETPEAHFRELCILSKMYGADSASTSIDHFAVGIPGSV